MLANKINKVEHKELIELEQQGKVLIGVDRAMARKFYTDIPISIMEEETGETPYFEKMIVWLAFLIGPISLVASLVLAFFALSWWGVICVFLCPFVYFIYSSSSVKGDSRMVGITIFFIVVTCVHFLGVFDVPWITGFATVFLFSLWCVRLLYCSSTLLLRSFVIRNARAFQYLSEYLVIRHVE